MVSIIVLVYNRLNLTRQTLDSLWSSLKPTPVDYELIVVDNGSVPAIKNLLHQEYEGFHLITLTKNIGVGAGKNLGVSHSRGDWLYISDNDMYFHPGWLPDLLNTANRFPEAKIIGAFRHPHHGVIKVHDRSNVLFEQSDQQVGSSWFLTRSTWDQFGPLDEGVDYGVDDVNFCNRVAAKKFWLGSILPYKVYHCGLKNSDGDWSPGGEFRLTQSHPRGVIIE